MPDYGSEIQPDGKEELSQEKKQEIADKKAQEKEAALTAGAKACPKCTFKAESSEGLKYHIEAKHAE